MNGGANWPQVQDARKKLFCDVASKIWQETCQEENRAYFIGRKQPLLCPALKNFDDFFGQPSLRNITVSLNIFKMTLFSFLIPNDYTE